MTACSANWRGIFAAIVLVVFGTQAHAQERRVYSPPESHTIHAVPAEHGMVVAQEKLAARIGADILRQGGNAVDAAVATGFAMAVTYPRAGNIGGGGFMVIHLGRAQRGHHDRLSRDRAGGDEARYFPGTRRQARYRKVARFRARHRRARHRRGPGARARQIRLGQVHAGGSAEAGASRWRPTASTITDDIADTLPVLPQADRALAVIDEDLLSPRRHAVARRRHR